MAYHPGELASVWKTPFNHAQREQLSGISVKNLSFNSYSILHEPLYLFICNLHNYYRITCFLSVMQCND